MYDIRCKPRGAAFCSAPWFISKSYGSGMKKSNRMYRTKFGFLMLFPV